MTPHNHTPFASGSLTQGLRPISQIGSNFLKIIDIRKVFSNVSKEIL